MRIALAQINTTVGALQANTDKVIEWMKRARELDADVVAFPEMTITGYPPEDLLLKPQFIEENLRCLQKIATETRNIVCIVGFVDSEDDVYNAAAVLHGGSLIARHYKHFLPNYGVFDEKRYFQAGTETTVVVFRSAVIGVNICEDIWYPGAPMSEQTLAGGADLIINISASPYHVGKGRMRENMLATRACDNATIIAFCNLIGGQDELVFDGHSMIVDETGAVIARGKQFEEDLIVADLDLHAVFRKRLHDPRRRQEKLALMRKSKREPGTKVMTTVLSDTNPTRAKCMLHKSCNPVADETEEVYRALVLGTQDYVRKNGFQKVVLGLSGGIDSSLTAAIAVDALGSDNVIGVIMPSQYSSEHGQEDARLLASNLCISVLVLPITNIFAEYLHVLEDEFRNTEAGVAEENLQARIRGNLLMALSNKFGWLVITTGNKSENSVGYCTLYGDMSGGLCIIKDVPKTLVYRLAQYRNEVAGKELIPQRVLEKEPSAELRPNQRDVDSLPPYPVLDAILKAYVEDDRSLAEVIRMGFEESLVRRVFRMVDRSEYKRRQASPGIKITPRAFGKDRRLPITNAYTENG